VFPSAAGEQLSWVGLKRLAVGGGSFLQQIKPQTKEKGINEYQ